MALVTFIGPFIATFFIALFVLLMQFLWKYIDDLAGKGLDIDVIAELLFYASAHLLPMALPLAVLLSSIMTFGNLAENHELLAFKTSGVSLVRIMHPLTITVMLVTVGAFFFANNAIPYANLKFKSLLWDITHQKPAMEIPEGAFYNGIEGFSIRVDDKDDKTGDLNNIMIYNHSEGRGNVMVTQAEKGIMKMTEDEKYLILELFNGIRYTEMQESSGASGVKKYPHNTLSFKRYQIRFDLSSFGFNRSDASLWKNHAQMLNVSQLTHYIDSCNGEIEKQRQKTAKFLKPYFVSYRDSLNISDTALSYMAGGNYPNQKGVVISGKQIIEKAMSQTRSVRSRLQSLQTEINYQMYKRMRGQIEWNRKFTMSLAILLMFFIGAPLGALIRKGGLGLPVVISTILFVLFYVIMIGMERAAKEYVISAPMGMWIPVLILLPIGMLLTFKANRDSNMLQSKRKLIIFINALRALVRIGS